MGIPIIEKLLPMAGAIVIPSSIHDLENFKNAISYPVKHKHPIMIYPEVHLWPWYTKIRKFSKSSFYYPYDNNSSIYVATTTYQKSKIFKRPNINLYIDGPIVIRNELSKHENILNMYDKTYNIMLKNSQLNNCKYIKYQRN